MRENVRNFSIGIVSATAIGGLAFLLLSFGELTGVLERRTHLVVALNAAGGLREGSLVTLHGVPVGLVDRIRFASGDATHPVRATVLVDRDTPIPASAAPVVEASLLGSGAKLELHSGPVAPGTATLDLASKPMLVGRYEPFDEKLMAGITAALDERLGALRTTLADSLGEFREFARTFTELGRNVNELVRPVASEEEREGSLRTTVERINASLTDARDALRLARGWLGDEALRADVRTAVSNANELLLRATDAVNVINGFMTNLDADRSVLVQHLVPVFDEARAALADVRRLLEMATSGDGTIGLLLKDPALHKDLAESAKHLSATLDALREVAERLKAEGIILKF